MKGMAVAGVPATAAVSNQAAASSRMRVDGGGAMLVRLGARESGRSCYSYEGIRVNVTVEVYVPAAVR
jgi:hypothetical protein